MMTYSFCLVHEDVQYFDLPVFHVHVWKETIIDCVLFVNSVLWLRMKSMGTTAPAPWATLALIVKENTVMAHCASMVPLAMPLLMAISVYVLLATLVLTVEKVIVIPHHAAMEQPVYLSVKAMNVSVITDSQ